MTCEHNYVSSIRTEGNCRCGSCGDIERPYVWCEKCDQDFEPEDFPSYEIFMIAWNSGWS